MASNTAEGGGNMMLRMFNVLTLISHPKRRSAVTRIGQAIDAARFPMLLRMARLDRFAEMTNQAVERLILGHRNGPRPRKIDYEFVNYGRRTTAHDHNAVREECRFADAMGDEDHRLTGDLPNPLQLDRPFAARDRVQCAEWLIHQQDAGIVHKRPANRDALPHAPRQLTRQHGGKFVEPGEQNRALENNTYLPPRPSHSHVFD